MTQRNSKIFVILGIAVVLLIFVLSMLFLPVLANWGPSVALRNFYNFNLAPTLKINGGKPTYTLTTVDKMEVAGRALYLYAFSGTFRSIDFEKNMIYLTGNDGKPYSYRFYLNLDTKGAIRNIFAFTYEGTARTLSINRKDPNSTESPFVPGDPLYISWVDDASLYEILSGSRQHPDNLLNQGEELNVNTFQLISKI